MAYLSSYGKAKIGDWHSPLDHLHEVFTAHPDWSVKKTVYNPAETSGTDRLEELWVEAGNTTSGVILGTQFKVDKFIGVEVAVSLGTDLSLEFGKQPNSPTDGTTIEGLRSTRSFLKDWGVSLSTAHVAVVISRDLIHVVWQGTSGDSYAQTSFMYCALDKTHAYSGGAMFVVSEPFGKSTHGTFYNEHWYQDGFGLSGSIEGLQGRLNGLTHEDMFRINRHTHGMYVAPISAHCNLSPDGADTALELAGFVPTGAVGAKYYQFSSMLIYETINGKVHVALPIYNIPNINTVLYPTT